MSFKFNEFQQKTYISLGPAFFFFKEPEDCMKNKRSPDTQRKKQNTFIVDKTRTREIIAKDLMSDNVKKVFFRRQIFNFV